MITSPKGKAYVGQTVWPVVRINKHANGKDNKCPAIASAIQKYGWEAMTVQILRGGHDAVGGPVAEDELDALEVQLIAEHGTRAPHGYNIQVGGKVAWRGLAGLGRTAPRGPRPREVKDKQMAVWAAKRERKWQHMDAEDVRKEKRIQEMRVKRRQGKADGSFVNGKHRPSQQRVDTWAAKREAKLALLPPEEAERERRRLERNRRSAMAAYERKKARRTPGNFLALRTGGSE